MFEEKINPFREEKKLPQRQLFTSSDIDMPMYSKIERGSQRARHQQVVKLAEIMQVNPMTSVTTDEKEYPNKMMGISKQNTSDSGITF